MRLRLLGKYEYGWIWIRMHSLARGPKYQLSDENLSSQPKASRWIFERQGGKAKEVFLPNAKLFGAVWLPVLQYTAHSWLSHQCLVAQCSIQRKQGQKLEKRSQSYQFSQTSLRALWSTMCGLGCVKSGFERCLRRFLLLCVGGRLGRPTQLWYVPKPQVLRSRCM